MHLLDGVPGDGEISEDARERVMADLRGHFRPEFLNRVDDIIMFKPLTLAEIERIVDLQIERRSPPAGRSAASGSSSRRRRGH